MKKFKNLMRQCSVILIGIIFFLFLVMPYMRGFLRKEISEQLFAEEIKDKDYEAAYEIFLKAKAGDNASPSYKDAIKSLKKVYQSTKNSGIKLRCYFLITFCQFIEGNISTSYKTGLETLNMAKKSNLKLDLLNKVISSIQNKEITKISEMTSLTAKDKEITGFINDLFYLQNSREKYQNMAKRCWRDYFKVTFDKKLSQSIKELKNLSVPSKEIKKIENLEKQFEKRGFFLPQELESVINEISIKYLTK